MRSPYRAALLVLATTVLLVGIPGTAEAAELAASDFVIVRQGTSIEDDLYAAALIVRIEGRVDGDLTAVAAERVVINGVVTGSVTVFAPTVEVNGQVGGSLRATAGRVAISGQVSGDVVVSAATVELSPASSVSGEIVVWGNQMSALGTVGNGLFGTVRRLDLAGTFGNSVVVNVGRLRVVDSLTIHGGLAYRSERDAEGLELAEVSGNVTRRTPLPPNIRVRALAIFTRAMVAIFLTIAAVATIWNWPHQTAAAADRVRERPVRSWLAGLAVYATPLLLVGVMAAMLAIAPPVASLPLVAILVPVILAVVALLAAASIVSGVPVALRLGRAMFEGLGPQGATLAGALILGLVWMIPWVGWLVPAVALPLGLGAWLSTRSGPDPGVVEGQEAGEDETLAGADFD